MSILVSWLPSAKVTVSRFLVLLKAEEPMPVTDLGMTMLVRPAQPLNRLPGIAVSAELPFSSVLKITVDSLLAPEKLEVPMVASVDGNDIDSSLSLYANA